LRTIDISYSLIDLTRTQFARIVRGRGLSVVALTSEEKYDEAQKQAVLDGLRRLKVTVGHGRLSVWQFLKANAVQIDTWDDLDLQDHAQEDARYFE
jgi:hypothetical protein